MNVAIIDFETTGVDFEKCRPIEIGVAIVPSDFSKTLLEYNVLMYNKDYPQLSHEVEALTKITNADIKSAGIHPAEVFDHIDQLFVAYKVEGVIAYNAEFDHTVYKNELKRMGMSNESVARPVKLDWICAMRDVRTNYKYKCWKLSHLALDYGVPIDPKELHRAMADVFLTIDMLRAAGTTYEEMLRYNKVQWVALEAITREPWKDGGQSTGKAKERGFTWETPRGHQKFKFSKKWVVMKKEDEVESFIAENSDITIRRIM